MMKFKPGQKVMVMYQSLWGEAVKEEGEAIIVCDNGCSRANLRWCDVQFTKDIERHGPNCPVYIRWIDTKKISELPLKSGGVMRCCVETLETTPVEEKEGEVVPCKVCSESLVLRNGGWEWNREAEEMKP